MWSINKGKRFLPVVLLAGFMGAGVIPASASAAGFYLGVDTVALSTQLDYGLTEDYSTTHLRLKAGYEFMNTLAEIGRAHV